MGNGKEVAVAADSEYSGQFCDLGFVTFSFNTVDIQVLPSGAYIYERKGSQSLCCKYESM